MSDIITMNDSPMNGVLWSREEEELLKDWALIANSFRWLHERSAIKFKRLNNRIALPVIIISTLTGTANFGLSTLVSSNDDNQTWAQIAIGGANIFCGVLTTIQTYFKYAENTEGHQNAAKNWSRFHRIISIELALQPAKRKHPSKFIRFCIEQYNELKEHSPTIPMDIASEFKSVFKKKKIDLPDIYDNISNTVTYNDYLLKKANDLMPSRFDDLIKTSHSKSNVNTIRDMSSNETELLDIKIDDTCHDLNHQDALNTDNLFNSALDFTSLNNKKQQNTILTKAKEKIVKNLNIPIKDYTTNVEIPKINVKDIINSFEKNISINLNNKLKEININLEENSKDNSNNNLEDNSNNNLEEHSNDNLKDHRIEIHIDTFENEAKPELSNKSILKTI